MSVFNKLLLKFTHPVRGLAFAIKNDTSIKLVLLLGAALALFGYLATPLSTKEILFLALSWTLVLITELQNTAFETALNRLHPERHTDIGRSKDIFAAATLAALVFVTIVVLVIFFTHSADIRYY